MGASFLEPVALDPIAAVLACRAAPGRDRGVEPAGASLRIGLSSSLSWGFLRELIRRAHSAPGAPELSFQEGTAGEIVRAVRRGDVDAGFVKSPAGLSGLKVEELWRERLMAAVPEGHPLTFDNEASAEALRKETFLIAGEPSDRDCQIQLIETVIGGPPAGIKRFPVERDTLINLVGLGFGVALVNGSSLGAFYPNVVYVPVAGGADAAPFRLVWKGDDHKPELGVFLATARALAARWAHDPAVVAHHR